MLSYLSAWGFAPVAGIIYYKIYTSNINNNWELMVSFTVKILWLNG